MVVLSLIFILLTTVFCLNFSKKKRKTGVTGDNGTKNVEITVQLKYLSNFWRTPAISLINCKTNLVLTQSDKFILSNDTEVTTFAITDTTVYVPVVTLPTQDNAKLFKQLESGFKRRINQNKYDPKIPEQAPNPYLDFLINPSFQEANITFVVSFENKSDRTKQLKYYLPTIEIKDCNVLIDGCNQ